MPATTLTSICTGQPLPAAGARISRVARAPVTFAAGREVPVHCREARGGEWRCVLKVCGSGVEIGYRRRGWYEWLRTITA